MTGLSRLLPPKKRGFMGRHARHNGNNLVADFKFLLTFRLGTWNGRGFWMDPKGDRYKARAKVNWVSKMLGSLDILFVQEAHTLVSDEPVIRKEFGKLFSIYFSHAGANCAGTIIFVRKSWAKDLTLRPFKCGPEGYSQGFVASNGFRETCFVNVYIDSKDNQSRIDDLVLMVSGVHFNFRLPFLVWGPAFTDIAREII